MVRGQSTTFDPVKSGEYLLENYPVLKLFKVRKIKETVSMYWFSLDL